MRRFSIMLALCAAVAGLVVPARADSVCVDVNGDYHSTTGLAGLTGPGGEPLEGHYALPASAPTKLVVFAHGYRNRSTSWEPHLLEAAATHGAIAVAMDYRGTGAAPDNRGWPVQAGAEDSIAAAQWFLGRCASITTTAILGVSMGGNSSGLAVQQMGVREYGSKPLFDYWVDVEGATNSTETYLEANAVAPVTDGETGAYIDGAIEDIHAACGGPLSPATAACYHSINVVANAHKLAVQTAMGVGLAGAVLVHGIDDGLVPYNQTREMAAALRAAGVPTDVYSVVRRGSEESDTTLSSNAGDPLFAGLGLGPYPNALAGHGWEGSTTHPVIRTGLDTLWELMDAGVVGPYREFVVDNAA